jgi:hypothetical protein
MKYWIALAALLAVSADSFAEAVTLPDLGFDMTAYITAFGGKLGAAFLVIIAMALAFMAIKKALRSLSSTVKA